LLLPILADPLQTFFRLRDDVRAIVTHRAASVQGGAVAPALAVGSGKML
jgi:hypothetical protein